MNAYNDSMSTPPATDGKAPANNSGTGPRIVAMLNQKGGVGKTTSTVNLGAALAEAKKRVCLIDLDPQAHLTLHLGISADDVERTVYDLFIDPECKASQVVLNARPNLDVILSEVDLAAAETELAQTPDRQTILRRKFAEIAHSYDVVIVDCPPSLGLLTLNALSLAREVFVPMQAHFLALQGVGKLLETVGLVCQSINPQLKVGGIVLCMHESQTTLAREIVADLDAFFTEARTQNVPWRDCRVLRPSIRRNVKLAEAPSFGKTILDYEPTCPGAADYRQLAREVMTAWGMAPPQITPPQIAPAPQVVSTSASASMSISPSKVATVSPSAVMEPKPEFVVQTNKTGVKSVSPAAVR
jgi:chromosome partitioning protein